MAEVYHGSMAVCVPKNSMYGASEISGRVFPHLKQVGIGCTWQMRNPELGERCYIWYVEVSGAWWSDIYAKLDQAEHILRNHYGFRTLNTYHQGEFGGGWISLKNNPDEGEVYEALIESGWDSGANHFLYRVVRACWYCLNNGKSGFVHEGTDISRIDIESVTLSNVEAWREIGGE